MESLSIFAGHGTIVPNHQEQTKVSGRGGNSGFALCEEKNQTKSEGEQKSIYWMKKTNSAFSSQFRVCAFINHLQGISFDDDSDEDADWKKQSLDEADVRTYF